MTGTSQGMHSLSTILKRLEAVTSRLEDVAVSQSSPAPTTSLRSHTSDSHDALAGHVASPAPPPPPPAPPAPPPASVPESFTPAVQAYQDEIIKMALADFISKASEVGGLVEQHVTSGHAKPSSLSALGSLLEPQAKAIQAITEAKDKLGRSKEGRDWGVCFNVLGEGVSAWGWVQVVNDTCRALILTNGSNPTAVAWAKAFVFLLDALQQYVKQWHTTGVVWNPKGPPAPATVPTVSAGSPPPPPPLPSASAPGAASATGGSAALLADLNRGGAVTSGLRKVDPNQMTHKNPDLRAAGAVPDNVKRAPALKPKPASAPVKKPAKMELEDGNKWIVVYLSKECMEAIEIITSKCSSINISVPTGADGDFEERPVPEQMKSRIVGGRLVTEIVEHAG
ncbi:hypothetical protein IAR55_006491 [Kwoniella newhampshirensis]|uniref:Adenylyl cyclase-associated protein n=1 Tax=Kwoniella newhampshirensis TaxID=1651941 RepID=A0AAW0YUA4_9TREE